MMTCQQKMMTCHRKCHDIHVQWLRPQIIHRWQKTLIISSNWILCYLLRAESHWLHSEIYLDFNPLGKRLSLNGLNWAVYQQCKESSQVYYWQNYQGPANIRYWQKLDCYWQFMWHQSLLLFLKNYGYITKWPSHSKSTSLQCYKNLSILRSLLYQVDSFMDQKR